MNHLGTPLPLKGKYKYLTPLLKAKNQHHSENLLPCPVGRRTQEAGVSHLLDNFNGKRTWQASLGYNDTGLYPRALSESVKVVFTATCAKELVAREPTGMAGLAQTHYSGCATGGM